MTTLQEQARALGDPTRHAVFRYVVNAGGPVGVAELTDHFELNHNAIRQHLAKLVDAGFLVSYTGPPAGRGRPRLLFEVDPSVDGRWGVEAPYERLSKLLAEVIRTGDAPVDVGRRSGADAVAQRHAATLADDGVDPVSVLVQEMARHGFDPVRTRDDASVEVVLETCPFVSAATTDPGIVCQLHLGIARGVAEAVGGFEVDGLDPTDPRAGGCRLVCHRVPADEVTA